MYDEFPNCTTAGCPNESSHDSGLCFTCRAQRRSFDIRITDGGPQHHDLRDERVFFAGRGPDEDGEEFHPMTDEEMAFAQARWRVELATPEGNKVPF